MLLLIFLLVVARTMGCTGGWWFPLVLSRATGWLKEVGTTTTTTAAQRRTRWARRHGAPRRATVRMKMNKSLGRNAYVMVCAVTLLWGGGGVAAVPKGTLTDVEFKQVRVTAFPASSSSPQSVTLYPYPPRFCASKCSAPHASLACSAPSLALLLNSSFAPLYSLPSHRPHGNG